ncbi:MAG: hypothetical protein L3J52_03605 [Proteobacteria bacterium]|nr:hypothetical protein [Pseudomonadota bacterium]
MKINTSIKYFLIAIFLANIAQGRQPRFSDLDARAKVALQISQQNIKNKQQG